MKFKAELIDDGIAFTPVIAMSWNKTEIDIVFIWLCFGFMVTINCKRKDSK